MRARILAFGLALFLMASAAEARRVALVIRQNAYPGGISATIGLPPLDNPMRDARRMAELLDTHGFEVITCAGKARGCIDLNGSQFVDALTRLEQRTVGADLALVSMPGTAWRPTRATFLLLWMRR